MNARCIELAGKALLIGGGWRLAESAAEVKTLRASAGRGAVVQEIVHATERSVVTYEGVKVHGTAYAGGAVVAKLQASVFVSHPLDDGNRWVFAAINGHPLPGFDRVVRATEVRSILQEASVSGVALEPIGDLPGAERTLEELMQHADDAVLRGAVHKATTSRLAPLLVGTVLAVSALGSYLAFGRTQAPQTTIQVATRPTPAVAPVVAASAASAPAAPLPRFASNDVLVGVLDALRGLPLSTRGWMPEQATCKTAAGSCEIVWAAASNALAQDAAAIPGVDMTVEAALSRRVKSRVQLRLQQHEVEPIPRDEALSLYSIGTKALASEVMSILFSPALPNASGIGKVPFKATGPLWTWKSLAALLNRPAISVDEVVVQQLNTTAPSISVSGAAAIAPTRAPSP